jgi:hypothetical protein
VCLVSISVQWPGLLFIEHWGGATIYSLIISGLNYIKADISVESPESSVMDSYFITAPCLIPSISLEWSHIWSEATPLGAAVDPIHHRRGVAGQRPHARILHHVPSTFDRSVLHDAIA